MKLTDHFSFEELTATRRTNLLDKNRQEAQLYMSNLQKLALLLEQVRAHFGKPLVIHSGFRGPTLNKAVGGAKTSQHLVGEAADFHVDGVTLQEVFDFIRKSKLEFGQCIIEGNSPGNPSWIHLSLPNPGRGLVREVMVYDGTKYTKVKA